MPHFKDLREFLADLGRRKRLYRFTEPVDKEKELIPLFRIQMRGLPDEERRVLFLDSRQEWLNWEPILRVIEEALAEAGKK